MSTKTDIQAARDVVGARGRSLRSLIEDAEVGRRHRASRVRIRWAKGDHPIRATVIGRDREYAVTIDTRKMDARYTCTCPDHGRAGPCKHVVAVAGDWITRVGIPAWRGLSEAIKALDEVA
jgi:hypothetical protein